MPSIYTRPELFLLVCHLIFFDTNFTPGTKIEATDMVSHKLVPYWFRLHEAYYTDDEDYWGLGDLSDHWDEFEQDSVVDLLDDFFQKYSDIDEDDVDDEDEQGKTFEVDRYEKGENIIEGEIKIGEYGIEADVYDTEEHERLHSYRKPHHSEETPFYFFFYKPPNYDRRAVAIFKEYKGRGLKGELFSRLQDYLSQFNPDDDDDRNDISAEMKPVYTKDADQQLRQAESFKKLKFEGKQELTPVEEHADNEGEIDVDRQSVSRVDEIRPVRNGKWSSEFVKSFGPNKEWKYGELDKEEYQDVKVQIEVDGSPMTFSLWHTDIQMRRNLDPIRLDMDGGHPTAESLSPKARGVASAVLPSEVDDPDDGTLL